MKMLSTGFLAALRAPRTRFAEGFQVERTDGAVYGWTSHDQNVTIAGVRYRASAGLAPSSAHTTDDLSVNTMDVTVFLDVSTEREVAAGIWDDATVTHFEYRWDVPPATLVGGDVLIKRYGQLGHVVRQKGLLKAEVRGLAQRLAVRTGRQYTPGCWWRFGGVECGVDLALHTQEGILTGIGGDATREMSDVSSGQADAYYNEGTVTMLSGPNKGITREVRAWVDHAFSLYFPFPFPVSVGDRYSATRGCNLLAATCKDVFDNYVNFGGFPDLQGFDQLYSNPVGL